MPDSMISADTGGSPKVTGSSIAIVAIGPMPGSTPTAVPRKTPIRQYSRFDRLIAVWKPSARFASTSIRLLLTAEPAAEEWHRNTEPFDEHQHAEHHDADQRGDRGGIGPGMLAGHGADDDQDGERNDNADAIEQQAEQNGGAENERQRLPCDRLDGFARPQERTYDRSQSEQRQDRAQHGGEGSGPHAGAGARRESAAEPEHGERERHIEGARPEVARIADVQHIASCRRARHFGGAVRPSSVQFRPRRLHRLGPA